MLSGGLDSTVNLYEADRRGGVALAVTFDYGQRAAKAEIRAARGFCRRIGALHRVIRLPWLAEVTASALVRKAKSLPHLDAKRLDDRTATTRSARAVWVPNRNGVFLSVAAAVAEAKGIPWIVPGFNQEEAATFPDNSVPFLRAFDRALRFSTRSHVRVRCFTANLRKPEIAKRGAALGIPLREVYPCYEAGPRPCGRCESCLRFRRAIAATDLRR